ncbi:ABC transporter ATP-binding protein [Propioniciclava coleopterorum]|uniref:ABC transporter ATP-binding protein n=1 Tax=Propioniciclava coleopterorum TaxID=2714937 RepID=A0A6G7Y7H1_9ACTN|nr:ABC transporter ATP-binding protein [Propioniciclava coleopterorum]QIK72762.1 ABC transporter ATP-binding protein [Propioniciclava coleopterorum]
MPGAALVATSGLEAVFGSGDGVGPFDLVIGPGEGVLVLGPSGSGKSTLLRLLHGAVPHAIHADVTGRAEIAGRSVADSTVAGLADLVGVVAQDPESGVCLPDVVDDVAFPLENLGAPAPAIWPAVRFALTRAGASGLAGRATGELSGGELQRVALAGAIAPEPPLLLLDEPTSMLDADGVDAVRGALASALRATGAAYVLVEHRLDELAGEDGLDGLPSRWLVLDRSGRVRHDVHPRALSDADLRVLVGQGCWLPAELELRALLGAPVPDAVVGAARPAPTRDPGRATLRDQQHTDHRVRREPPSPGASGTGPGRGAPAAAASPALGPTGTLLDPRLTERRPAGSIPARGPAAAAASPARGPSGIVDALLDRWLAGRRPAGTGPAHGGGAQGGAAPASPAGAPLVARGLAVGRGPGGRARPVLSDVDADLRGGELVALVGANGSGKSTLLACLAGLIPAAAGSVAGPRPGLVFQNPEHQFAATSVRAELMHGLPRPDDPETRERVDAMLARFGLLGLADRNPFRLSGGQQRRVSLAAMLLHRRPHLLADEPAFGLDRLAALTTMRALRAAADAGQGVLFSSHDLRAVAAHADRVLVVGEGTLLAAATPHELLRDRVLLDRARLRPPHLLLRVAEASAGPRELRDLLADLDDRTVELARTTAGADRGRAAPPGEQTEAPRTVQNGTRGQTTVREEVP